MLEIIVIFSAALLGYLFLRMQGGKGLSINAKLPPASSSEGRRARIMAWIVVALIAAALVFVTVGGSPSRAQIITSLGIILVGVAMVLAPYLLKNRKN